MDCAFSFGLALAETLLMSISETFGSHSISGFSAVAKNAKTAYSDNSGTPYTYIPTYRNFPKP